MILNYNVSITQQHKKSWQFSRLNSNESKLTIYNLKVVEKSEMTKSEMTKYENVNWYIMC